MNLNIDTYSKLKREYDIKRQKAINDMENKVRKLKKDVPKYVELDEKKNIIAIEHAKIMLSGKKVDKQIAEENLSIKIAKLDEEINKIFEKNKIAKDYINIKYECDKCKDTGFITSNTGTEHCRCFVQKLVNMTYNQENTSKLDEENFSTFDIGFYAKEPNQEKYKINISPRENIENIKKIAEKFCSNIDNKNQKNLLFIGKTGTGKTFISNSIAKKTMDLGYTVLYQTAPVLMDTILDSKFSYNKEDVNKEKYYRIFDVDLLIIDDLGTETLNNNRFTEFFNIINTRLLKNKKTVISTNLTLNELGVEYDERIISRLIGNYIICKFVGDDIRLKKKRIYEGSKKGKDKE